MYVSSESRSGELLAQFLKVQRWKNILCGKDVQGCECVCVRVRIRLFCIIVKPGTNTAVQLSPGEIKLYTVGGMGTSLITVY